MGVFRTKIRRPEQLKPGDHIYSWRAARIYAHHGIYVGDGMVIHFTTGAGQETGTIFDSSFRSGGTSCPRCGGKSRSGGVISSCLDCFLKGGKIYLFEYGVSPAASLIKSRAGTCTVAPSDSSEDTVHRASCLLGNGFGGYNLFKNNCEDFAIYCKTGLLAFNITSAQVTSYLVTAMLAGQGAYGLALALAVFPVGSVPIAGLSGIIVTYAVCHRLSRLAIDIGRPQRGICKVPVECLIASPENTAEMAKED